DRSSRASPPCRVRQGGRPTMPGSSPSSCSGAGSLSSSSTCSSEGQVEHVASQTRFAATIARFVAIGLAIYVALLAGAEWLTRHTGHMNPLFKIEQAVGDY